MFRRLFDITAPLGLEWGKIYDPYKHGRPAGADFPLKNTVQNYLSKPKVRKPLWTLAFPN